MTGSARDGSASESGTLVATKPLTELADAIPDGIRLLIEHTADRLPAADRAVRRRGDRRAIVHVGRCSWPSTNRMRTSKRSSPTWLGEACSFTPGENSWPDGTITSAFAFDHDLYRDVVYGRVGVTQTAGYHLRIGSPWRPATSRSWRRSPRASPCTSPGAATSTALCAIASWPPTTSSNAAPTEAIDHLHAAAVLLTRLPDDPTHLEEAVHVQVALGNALLTAKGYAAPETANAYRQARRLCDRLGDGIHVLPVLYGLWNASLVAGQRAALEIAETFLTSPARPAPRRRCRPPSRRLAPAVPR